MTALVKENGIEDLSYLYATKEYYIERLMDAHNCVRSVKMPWAKFIEKHEMEFEKERNVCG